jgi:ATP-binding cassette subfamily B protein
VKRVWHTFRRILPYLRPSWKLAVYSLIFTLLGAGVSLLLPWPLALIFDSVLGNKPLPAVLAPLGSLGRFELLALLALAGLGLTAALGIVGVLSDYVNSKLELSMVLDFRSDMFQHAQRLSLAYHDRRLTGMFSAQINLQAAGAGAIVVAIPPLLQALVTLVGMFVITYRINAQLALLALSVVPFVYYSTGYYAKRIEPRLVEVRSMEAESLSIVHEAMAMLRVIIPFGRERHEYRRFREQGESAVAARVDLTVRQTLFSTVVSIITAAGTALVLGFGAYQILQGKMSGGELLVVITYVAAVYSPLEQITSTISSLQEQFVNVRGALQVLDTEPEVKDAPGAYDIGRVNGNVAFEGVHFNYKGRVETLKDISFEVRAGQRIAIVGPTGAGKTTLTSLIPRLYDPKRGRILLDGVDITKVTLKSLRENISIVMQDPLLFSTSIAENIRYGRLEASMEEVVEAAKAANAHDFIMGLPEQYETKLGEGGSLLSGGERQRISIARAFLKDAPILILDEPTSAIDSKTEAVILDSLERLMVGRTCFMIAHRLSTIRNADLILVINDGQLVEQGTHGELLERRGLYRQLYEAQTGQVRDNEQIEWATPQTAAVAPHNTNGGVPPAARRKTRVHQLPIGSSGEAEKTQNSDPTERSEEASLTTPGRVGASERTLAPPSSRPMREQRNPESTADEPSEERPSEHPPKSTSERTFTALPPPPSATDYVKALHKSRRTAAPREPESDTEHADSRKTYAIVVALLLPMIVFGLYLGWHLGQWISAIVGM